MTTNGHEHEEKDLAAQHVADDLQAVFCQEATGFTCTEAETLAEFLRVWANEGAATAFLVAHAEGDDDDGDLHYLDEEGHLRYRNEEN